MSQLPEYRQKATTAEDGDQDREMKPIEEKELVGQWLLENGKIVGGETENRIWPVLLTSK